MFQDDGRVGVQISHGLAQHPLHPLHARPPSPTRRPEDSWPEDGHIVYDNVWMRYRPELDPVLKGGWGLFV